MIASPTAPNEPRDAVARTIRDNADISYTETAEVAYEIVSKHIAPRDAEIERLRAEAGRSEKHRNDLMDTIVSLRTERGALREQLAAQKARADEIWRLLEQEREALQDEIKLHADACMELAETKTALSEERARVAGMREVLRPFAACVFNDNFDVTLSTGRLSDRNWVALERLHRALTEEAGHAER